MNPELVRNGARSATPARGVSAGVRSVGRTVDILEVLVSRVEGLSLTQIAAAVGAPKSTTLDILRTLAARGLVAHDPGRRTYRLGLGLARFAPAGPPVLDLDTLARPHLEALARETRETAYMTIRQGHAMYYTSKVDSPEPVRYMAQVGLRRPLHATASGKLALASMTDGEVRDYLRRHGLPRYTPSTIVDRAALLRELDKIRRRGHAVNRGEFVPDLFGVSAPLVDADGGFAGAVNVGGPLFRLGARAPALARAVMAAGTALAAEIRLSGLRGRVEPSAAEERSRQ